MTPRGVAAAAAQAAQPEGLHGGGYGGGQEGGRRRPELCPQLHAGQQGARLFQSWTFGGVLLGFCGVVKKESIPGQVLLSKFSFWVRPINPLVPDAH